MLSSSDESGGFEGCGQGVFRWGKGAGVLGLVCKWPVPVPYIPSLYGVDS